MQSEQNSFDAEASKIHGHRRTPSMGKAMPVTSLLLNFPPPLRHNANRTRDGYSSDQDEQPPMYFPIIEPPSAYSLFSSTSTEAKTAPADEDSDDDYEQEYEILVSECSSEADGNQNGEDGEKTTLIGNSMLETPCLTCTNSAPDDLGARTSAINEMCRRLCTDECRLRLSLGGFVPPSEMALKSKNGLADFVASNMQRPLLQHNDSEETLQNWKNGDIVNNNAEAQELPSTSRGYAAPRNIAIQRKTYLTNMLTENDDFDSENVEDEKVLKIVKYIVDSANDEGDSTEGDDAMNTAIADTHEIAMLKDFHEQIEIAEALAKTSAMTSTSKIKQRLAARKLEIELDNPNINVNAIVNGCGVEQGANALTHATADVVATTAKQNGSEYEPSRDLLLYLVRMGSFNSAPKINNIDSQDDGLEVPKGMNTSELLQHVKHLRGKRPPLLSRYFLKPSLAAQMVSNDITDGLRYLKLNSVSRVCSAPMKAPNQLRLLQWNILSQTLGQKNDGFVRCPEEALTWENRKFLIVEEILQNNPDIICLQEVDHYKFLQNILGSQDYEGIFFPKADSPCLYIEENNGPDGCAIFFKRDKFELKNYDTRILEVWRVQSNQVAIAANFLVKATGTEICVCTTHLKARHGALLSKLRNEQGRDLMRFVQEFAGERPVILAGDFNAEPIEPVYTTILNCEKLKLSSAYADIKAESESDECNNDNALANDEENDEGKDANDKVTKSIQCEPPYTTWKIREDGEVCHTIDYVFYSKDQLKVKNCLEFPQGDEIGENRTPSFQYPSDHFSLVCDFEIIDKQQKNKTQ